MCNCYIGENMKNKMTLFLTTLVHLFSHFELVILALNPSLILQPKGTVSVPEGLRILFAVSWRTPLFHPKDYTTSVCIWLLNYRSLKNSLVTVIYLRFFTTSNSTLILYIVSEMTMHMPWTLVGWACPPAPGNPEIPMENCSWIAWVDFIELGSDFLMKNLISIVFSISNATDMLQIHAQTVSKVCAVWYWLLGKSGLKYHISLQRHTWLQAPGTKLH